MPTRLLPHATMDLSCIKTHIVAAPWWAIADIRDNLFELGCEGVTWNRLQDFRAAVQAPSIVLVGSGHLIARMRDDSFGTRQSLRWHALAALGRSDEVSLLLAAGVREIIPLPPARNLFRAAMEALAGGVAKRVDAFRARERMRSHLASLNSRERQVLELLSLGLTNKQVAARLGIGLRTVEARRHDIMAKTKAHSFAELMLLTAASARTDEDD